MSNELRHYGVLGMRWGIRKQRERSGGLDRQDRRWVRKNSDKITRKAMKQTSREMYEYGKELMRDPNAHNKSGKLSASTINAYNRKMASLMNEQVSGLTSPSGKTVSFVAKRGEIGVMMALADQGYNMDRIKNGVYTSGKVAYKNTVLDKM